MAVDLPDQRTTDVTHYRVWDEGLAGAKRKGQPSVDGGQGGQLVGSIHLLSWGHLVLLKWPHFSGPLSDCDCFSRAGRWGGAHFLLVCSRRPCQNTVDRPANPAQPALHGLHHRLIVGDAGQLGLKRLTTLLLAEL